ncbi:MAG: squalene/phytoene synthase family protein [Steroidobacteraceae bacterium]
MPARPEARGTARYWAWLYSPPRLRAVLEALLLVEDEVRAVLAAGLDHHIAHVRLEWWREECARYAHGTPAHPLMRALLEASQAPSLDAVRSPGTAPDTANSSSSCVRVDPTRVRPDPAGLVDIVAWDLAAAPFATRDELAGYCDRWASAVTEVAATGTLPPESHVARSTCAAHATDEPGDVARFGHALGRPLKEIELLGDLAADARRGRLRLPLDELERDGIEPHALACPPWPAALCRLLQRRQRSSRAALARSVAELPPSRQPALRGLLVWAAVAHHRSLRAERALPRSWEASGTSRLAEVGIGWRAARLAGRCQFQLKPENAP